MSRIRRWTRGWLDLIDERLQACLFLLMCLGIVVSSVFLAMGIITGEIWAMVHGILFGSNAVGGGLSQLGRGRAPADADSGNQRPL